MTDPGFPYASPTPISPLAAPLYGATPVQAVKRLYTKYATFSGRASRSEYWWVALFNVVVYFVLSILAGVTGAIGSGGSDTMPPAAVPFAIVIVIFTLGSVIPGIAVTVRRLHDANLSGWLVLLHLVPYLGSLVVTILTILPTVPQGVRFDASA